MVSLVMRDDGSTILIASIDVFLVGVIPRRTCGMWLFCFYLFPVIRG